MAPRSALATDPGAPPADGEGAPGAADRTEGWTLVIVRGPGRGTTVPLVLAETLVGRVDSNRVVIDDPSVSRVHARLRLSADGVEIEDLQSRAGTRVNGAPIAGPQQLHDGDEIVLGAVVLILSGPGGHPPRAG